MSHLILMFNVIYFFVIIHEMYKQFLCENVIAMKKSYVILYCSCHTMDPLQWMGAVRMRFQTADKNITIIHK